MVVAIPAAASVKSRAERVAKVSAPGWADGVRETLRSRRPQLMVDNAWVDARSGRTADTFDPSTGEVVGQYALADAADVDDAVQTAHRAQPAWAALTVLERSQYLFRLRELVEENAELLATTDAINAGLPVERMFNDIDNLLRVLHLLPGLASSLRGAVLEGVPGLHYVRYVPYGVVARIVAFNHPILFAVKGCLAPLMAGNAVVLKPADQTPASAQLLGDIVREVFPPGVFNVITGDGATGEALVTHPLIRRIAFTGSVRTGMAIQSAAARDRVRHVSLELGGKNAMIVFPDANVTTAAQSAVLAMNLRANSGQSCGSTARILVHRDIHDEFAAALAEALSKLTLGPAYDSSIDMGPLISPEAADRVRGYIASGVSDGAQLVSGGLEDPRVPAQGNFVAPTLFSHVPEDSRIANEEIFGPVIALRHWDDYDDMIRLVNSVDYGLTASIWTNDLDAAHATADRVEAGYVWINESTTHYFGTPFGGFKDSGIGREESIEEIESYYEMKSVHVKLGQQG